MLRKVAVVNPTSVAIRLKRGLGINVPTAMKGTEKTMTSNGKSWTLGNTRKRYKPEMAAAMLDAMKNRNTCGAGSSSAAKKQQATAASDTPAAPSTQSDSIHSAQFRNAPPTAERVEKSMIPRSKNWLTAPS